MKGMIFQSDINRVNGKPQMKNFCGSIVHVPDTETSLTLPEDGREWLVDEKTARRLGGKQVEYISVKALTPRFITFTNVPEWGIAAQLQGVKGENVYVFPNNTIEVGKEYLVEEVADSGEGLIYVKVRRPTLADLGLAPVAQTADRRENSIEKKTRPQTGRFVGDPRPAKVFWGRDKALANTFGSLADLGQSARVGRNEFPAWNPCRGEAIGGTGKPSASSK